MSTGTISRGAQNQRVKCAGEHFVIAELNKRGAYAVTFSGNMPEVDLIACNQNRCRTIFIQVKTKKEATHGMQASSEVDQRNRQHLS